MKGKFIFWKSGAENSERVVTGGRTQAHAGLKRPREEEGTEGAGMEASPAAAQGLAPAGAEEVVFGRIAHAAALVNGKCPAGFTPGRLSKCGLRCPCP